MNNLSLGKVWAVRKASGLYTLQNRDDVYKQYLTSGQYVGDLFADLKDDAWICILTKKGNRAHSNAVFYGQ